ncbi:MAG: aspartate carbamoyltransferase catalytic subunit [Deltaproteobacteria bacterium]|nr:aspartate carbamoyltransferase catalytic subunit [Deltaproteobacteria bacterium]
MSSTDLKIGPHLLGIRGLSREQVEFILATAAQFVEVSERPIKRVPTLRGKTVVNLFLEASTRTRTSFEIAAKRLSADAVNIGAKDSSVTKGETLLDTVWTLQAMAPDVIVMRHPSSGAAHFIAQHLTRSAVVNAGDGLHEHPTQALLDALTIKQKLGKLTGLKIVLVGDVFRGRVARSNIFLHTLLGNEVRAVAPPTFIPPDLAQLGVKLYHDLPSALDGADVVMSLRIKTEYLQDAFIPSTDEYCRRFCITEPILAKYAPESIVLAPGPFNRGIEMSSEVVDGPRSQISKQVNYGVAVRMAVIYLLAIRQGAMNLSEHLKEHSA